MRHVEGVGPGLGYGYRGPWTGNHVARGLRCNPAKLLLDPYVSGVAAGSVAAATFAYPLGAMVPRAMTPTVDRTPRAASVVDDRL